jgi:hypothetical protein
MLVLLLLARAIWIRWYPDAHTIVGVTFGLLIAATGVVCGALLVHQGALLPVLGREVSFAAVLLLGTFCFAAEIHRLMRPRPSRALSRLNIVLGRRG